VILANAIWHDNTLRREMEWNKKQREKLESVQVKVGYALGGVEFANTIWNNQNGMPDSSESPEFSLTTALAGAGVVVTLKKRGNGFENMPNATGYIGLNKYTSVQYNPHTNETSFALGFGLSTPFGGVSIPIK
jgi:hypothetical protein